MQSKISVNLLNNFVSQDDLLKIETRINKSVDLLTNKSGDGSEFTGWLDLPTSTLANKQMMAKIENETHNVKLLNPEYIVVIGIGGSYLGTKAVYEALKPTFPKAENPQIIFAGHHLDSSYHKSLIEFLEDKNFVVVVISKSGTTTEPAIAFRLLRNLLEKKFGETSSKHIFVVTDEKKGALRTLANEKKYASFVIPDNVGGRFSVFTPVGLLPLAFAGFDIKMLLQGAADAENFYRKNKNISNNPAICYAAIRQILYLKGKSVEILASFHPALSTISEWWKQLFGESEGKMKKGILPTSLSFTSDLHSLGQFVQDGSRTMFETFIRVCSPTKDICIPSNADNYDGLEFLSGKKISHINNIAETATKIAHCDGGVPVIEIEIEKLDEQNIGNLLYFFEYACGISAYTLGVNPFDQPGVEAYKKNMFALLGKSGYDDLRKKLLNRLK